MEKFNFECGSIRVAKELIAQGFECRAILGTHGKLLFMFERNDEVRKAYREAKDKIFND